MARELAPDPFLLSVDEAAAVMKVSRDVVYDQLRDDDRFAACAVRVGRRIRISRIRLEQFLHGMQVVS